MGTSKPLSPHTGWLFMFVQIAFESKGFTTSTTNIWFFCWMSLDVSTQIAFVRKSFVAFRAFKWLFPCMSTDVTLEKPRARKLFSTERAFTSLVVCAHMHAVCWHGNVHFFTVGALLGFFVIHRPVSLAMARQVRWCWVPFSTVRTHVYVTNIDLTPGFFNQLIKSVIQSSNRVLRFRLPCFEFG